MSEQETNARLAAVLERYEATIGLEVQLEANTRSKAYCGCANVYGATPNTRVCPVCTGQPGALPVPNRGAFEKALRIALALGCEIAEVVHFDRKNYFYPDLPKGYQITQHMTPLGRGGELRFPAERYAEETAGRVEIERVHLEEDTAKSVHDGEDSLIDFNRAGVPLLEVVTEPCIHDPVVAYYYLLAFRDILLWIDASDCNMEEGSLRVDTNVSVAPVGDGELGTKVEVKNLNSFKGVRQALEYEIVRQAELLDGGGRVVQETRHWDAARGVTLAGRVKEGSMDYRYFPEPDIPPLSIPASWVEELREDMPELPQQARERLHAAGLSGYDAWVLVDDRERLAYYEAVVAAGAPAKPAANWVNGDLAALLKEDKRGFGGCPLPPEQLGELVGLLEAGTINTKTAKKVLIAAYNGEGEPGGIVEERGLGQISDEGAVRELVAGVLAEHPDKVEAYRNGKTALSKFFVGQVMKASRGKADPRLVNGLVGELLEG
jgi:aspartyl-tRNA(Asn)/glutamyl-tRNA(Gln) amidotransferase subunit B